MVPRGAAPLSQLAHNPRGHKTRLEGGQGDDRKAEGETARAHHISSGKNNISLYVMHLATPFIDLDHSNTDGFLLM